MIYGDLANSILQRCNNFTFASGIHVANVAYAPRSWYDRNKGSSELWKVKGNNQLLLAGLITVYLKDDLKDEQIAVAYMETPRDEMLRKNVPSDAFIDIDGQRFLKSSIMCYAPILNESSENMGIVLYFHNSTNSSRIKTSSTRASELLETLDSIFKTVKL